MKNNNNIILETKGFTQEIGWNIQLKENKTRRIQLQSKMVREEILCTDECIIFKKWVTGFA